ncbi:glycosyltransferase family 2 protein [Geobacillus icigianus]|uniref:Glycosyltransferase 2-like domain-containing protein n=1 Tax=Geobacillus icigianus TaxID=1430331 RepID=A0ABU6BGN6_9BACL|nr:glycosyltransferase family 2 protein [Geobacillus icigianus]MEB3750977.1 hypothetical protein [Geobacillus icigianus]
METVCAVIVTYNRLEMLKECIDALLKQTYTLDGIIIINNNSTDGTKEYLDDVVKENKKIQAIHLDENVGGAGGFHVGVKEAFERGYDWIWIMDDDAEPRTDCLKILMDFVYRHKDVGFVAPLIVNKYSGKIQNYHHKRLNRTLTRDIPISLEFIDSQKVIELDANAFVGPLISKAAVETVGFPRHDFFIWLDDTEYTYRIKQKTNSFLITDAVIFHKDGIAPIDSIRNFWKVCYGLRNRSLWINSELRGVNLFIGHLCLLLEFIRLSLWIMLKMKWKHNRILGLKYLIRTLFCSYRRISGRFIDPSEYLRTLR